jgi:hypothetical protein
MTAVRAALMRGARPDTLAQRDAPTRIHHDIAPCPAHYFYVPAPSPPNPGGTMDEYEQLNCWTVVFIRHIYPKWKPYPAPVDPVPYAVFADRVHKKIGVGYQDYYGNAEIATYSANWAIQSLTNQLSGAAPLSMAADAAGNTYVAAWPSNQIAVYAPGGTDPAADIIDIGLTAVYGVAVDKAGDLFASGFNTYGNFEVDEASAGSNYTFTALPISGQFPGGLAIDSRQNLWVCDQGDGSSGSISKLAPPYTGRAKVAFSYAGDNFGIAISSDNKSLIAANNVFQGSQSYSGAVIYSLPSGSVQASSPTNPGIMTAATFRDVSSI